MGRGNVCVTGKYEGLYYIDRDYTDMYRREDEYSDDDFETKLLGELDYGELTGGEWLYDDWGSAEEFDDVLQCFIEGFTKRFPSFKRVTKEKWLDRSIRVILENELFYIGVEDNEWSEAVKLLQKEPPYGDGALEGLQKRHYEQYLEGMKQVLLERLPSIGTYSGAWTSGRLTREELQ